jgi:hypothetical protein
MMKTGRSTADKRAAISMRTMEVVVALLLLAIGATVVFDSYRLGSKWGSDGPQSGYFPFYIGLMICISSAVTLAQTLFGKSGRELGAFVERGQLRLVLMVLVPALLYVLAVQFIGIYIASAVYIALFMWWLGHYAWWKASPSGAAREHRVFSDVRSLVQGPAAQGHLRSAQLPRLLNARPSIRVRDSSLEEINALFHGFAVALTPFNLLLMFIGVTLGVIIGVLPGSAARTASRSCCRSPSPCRRRRRSSCCRASIGAPCSAARSRRSRSTFQASRGR